MFTQHAAENYTLKIFFFSGGFLLLKFLLFKFSLYPQKKSSKIFYKLFLNMQRFSFDQFCNNCCLYDNVVAFFSSNNFMLFNMTILMKISFFIQFFLHSKYSNKFFMLTQNKSIEKLVNIWFQSSPKIEICFSLVLKTKDLEHKPEKFTKGRNFLKNFL